MQLIISRNYPAMDVDTLAMYSARDSLFRAADGSFLLHMMSLGDAKSEERVLFFNSRDALIWLAEPSDALGFYWHSAEP